MNDKTGLENFSEQFVSCETCFALVQFVNIESHQQWHKDMEVK